MRSGFATVVLIGLLGVVHGQLWYGRGSVGSVQELQRKLDDQKQRNTIAQGANARLGAEVRDLQEGLEIVEERARSELGMVKPNEILVQVTR